MTNPQAILALLQQFTPAELKAMYAILDPASEEIEHRLAEERLWQYSAHALAELKAQAAVIAKLHQLLNLIDEPCICGGNHYSREHDCQFLECDEDCEAAAAYNGEEPDTHNCQACNAPNAGEWVTIEDCGTTIVCADCLTDLGDDAVGRATHVRIIETVEGEEA
jgi:hypothetical protein